MGVDGCKVEDIGGGIVHQVGWCVGGIDGSDAIGSSCCGIDPRDLAGIVLEAIQWCLQRSELQDTSQPKPI